MREDRSGFTLAELLIVVAIGCLWLWLCLYSRVRWTAPIDRLAIPLTRGEVWGLLLNICLTTVLLIRRLRSHTMPRLIRTAMSPMTTTVDADATPVDNLTDDTALTLGQAISGSDDPTPVSVTIQGADISK